MSLFPVPAQGTMTATLTYRQVLPRSQGLVCWSFPWLQAGLDGSLPEMVELDLRIRSQVPLRTVIAPLPAMRTQRLGEHEARVTLKGTGWSLPRRELQVLYRPDSGDFGLELLTWREPGDAGYFLLQVAPKAEWRADERLPLSAVALVDASAEVSGSLLRRERLAVRGFLRSLQPEDRFNVVPFRARPAPFFARPERAGLDQLAAAFARVEDIAPDGAPDLASAMTTALAMTARPGFAPAVLLVTGSKAPDDAILADQILAAAQRANTPSARISVLALEGSQGTTRLLSGLATEHSGQHTFVGEGDDVARAAAGLIAPLRGPALLAPELSIQGVECFALNPKTLPNLFQGDRVVITGRYRGSGSHTVRLGGETRTGRREWQRDAEFAQCSLTHDFVPALWARQRVNLLLEAIRVAGAHELLVDEVRRLSGQFRLATPYASHLVLEPGMRRPETGIRGQGFGQPLTAGGNISFPPPAAPPAGRCSGCLGARQRTLGELVSLLRDAGVLPAHLDTDQGVRLLLGFATDLRAVDSVLEGPGEVREPAEAAARYLEQVATGPGPGTTLAERFVRSVAGKRFALRDGFWTDTTWDTKTAPRRMVAFTRDWLALATDRPELRPWLGFSARLRLMIGGEALEVVDQDPGRTSAGPVATGR